MTAFFRWPPSPPVRVAIAAGLALLGVVLVWAALDRPATPGFAVASAPSEPGVSSSPSEAPARPARSSAPHDGRSDVLAVM